MNRVQLATTIAAAATLGVWNFSLVEGFPIPTSARNARRKSSSGKNRRTLDAVLKNGRFTDEMNKRREGELWKADGI